MNARDMHYVVLRDDDTNALTPPGCLEQLYRPFLERGLPVNLAVIPEVRTDVRRPDGRREGFLPADAPAAELSAITDSPELIAYLKKNPGYCAVQHGCHHDHFEFELPDRAEIRRRIERGQRRFAEAGFGRPRAFVAPHDRFSRASLAEVASRFEVVSTGWFERRRLPVAWWPRYLAARFMRAPHWRAGQAALLSHPGCLLSCYRPLAGMLERVKEAVQERRLTVLVTHWWEYFPGGRPHPEFIRVLHETADYLAGRDDVRAVSFDELAAGRVPLR